MIRISVEPSPLDGGEDGWEVTGAITAQTKNSFVIDTCAPSTGCVPKLMTITVDVMLGASSTTPGVDLGLQVGAYVRVRHQTYGYDAGQVAAKLGVANVPSWNGKQNPVSGADVWEFFATDGALLVEGTPFEVSSATLDCAQPPEGKGTSYKVQFRASAADPWTELQQDFRALSVSFIRNERLDRGGTARSCGLPAASLAASKPSRPIRGTLRRRSSSLA